MPRVCTAGGLGGSLVCPLPCWAPAVTGLHSSGSAGGGASLAAVLRGRGRGSLSVFVLLLLHLLHDFPDLALGSLGRGQEMGVGMAEHNSITAPQLLTLGQARE